MRKIHAAAVAVVLLLAATPPASAEPDAPMQISVSRANGEPLPIAPYQSARIDVDAAATGPRTIRLKRCDAAGCEHVQFEHQTDAQGRHTFFVSPDRTTDYVVGMPPDGTLQGRAQRITVPVAGPAEKPAPPEQSIQIFMGARTHQPGADPAPARKAQAPVEVVAAPVQPGRGIQLYRQKLNAAGTPIGDWKEWRRTQQDGAGRAFLFVPVAAGGGRQWRYTAHSHAQGDYPRVSAVHHASEAANGWTEVFDDQFGGKALKSAKWSHRAPRPADVATLCGKNDEKRFRDFSDNSVTRVAGGVLQLDTRPVRRCGKGREWVRANANIGTRAPDAFAADGTYLFAARMKLPATRGNFPAFWFRAADRADMGELDIIESFGRPRRPATWCKPSAPGAPVQVVTPGDEPRTGLLTNVYWNDDPSGIKRCLGVGELRRLGIPQYDGKQLTQFNRFHVYSAVWAPGRYYRIYVDGIQVHEFGPQNMSAQPRFLILSNFVNDSRRAHGGNGRAAQVDWVRVWKTG